MILADFRCECGEIIEVSKPTIISDWPKVICEKCGEEMTRLFTPLKHEIARGRTGNASTGYQSEITYHRASATGSGKRTKV